MAGIGDGEYDPITIAGLVIDIIILVLTGVKNRASSVGDITAVVLIMVMLGTLLGTFVVLPGLLIGGIMAFTYVKGKRKSL